MRPNAITCQLAGSGAQLLVARDFNIAGKGLQRALQCRLHIGLICCDCGCGQFVYEGVGPVGLYDNLVEMRSTMIGAVLEYTSRRKEDERENDRDHHVIVKAAARMGPQYVALKCLS